MPTANAIGVDVSKYNLGWDPDRATKRIDFVIQRSSWAGYKDEQFDAIYTQVIKVPIRGAYHYYSSGVHWRVQADLFLNITRDRGFHFFVLDYETAYNNLDGRTIAEAAEFVKYIKEQTGKRCLLYFSPNVYSTYIKPFGYANWCNQQDIWMAQYPWTLTQEPPYYAPKLPTGLANWNIWQYGGGDVNYTAGRHAGADYGGGTVGIDLNYYNGTAADMLAWASASTAPIVPPVVPQSSIGWLKPRYVANGPAIIAGSDAPKANHPTIALDDPAQTWLLAINNNDSDVWKLWTAPDVGPSKGINDNGKLIYIVAGWSGNIVKMIGRSGSWVKVESIPARLPYPTVNHKTAPWLVHKMTTVSSSNKFITYPLRPNGLPSAWDSLYDPLLSVSGDFWLPAEWLSTAATLNTGVNIRSGPGLSYPIVGGLVKGTRITPLTMVEDGAGNRWAQISTGRWCCVRYGGNMYTDWWLV